jgi:hypothetical protein
MMNYSRAGRDAVWFSARRGLPGPGDAAFIFTYAQVRLTAWALTSTCLSASVGSKIAGGKPASIFARRFYRTLRILASVFQRRIAKGWRLWSSD